ncbi:hypothetical protein GCM10007301_33810 [Azorhizobium oxalatiphilum]|uniref:Uncharacterized protein n=1 Tax=Azorhizobium oxalatiphilum TaxID=980631 RepID=A0A917C442_9HYPH|nr:hypothetical protein [Azorhizobium oxalatiphilum]GGF71312.1 hypothetical protein GCM10007301_33810 [Azorhizobium oxalatiphilum]
MTAKHKAREPATCEEPESRLTDAPSPVLLRAKTQTLNKPGPSALGFPAVEVISAFTSIMLHAEAIRQSCHGEGTDELASSIDTIIAETARAWEHIADMCRQLTPRLLDQDGNSHFDVNTGPT